MSESTTASPPPAEPGAAAEDTTIRPFRVDIRDEALDDLRRRIAATRWPSRELVPDRSQGVQLATLQELARYWTSDYDFLHVKSPHEGALALIMTHGWPGSVGVLGEGTSRSCRGRPGAAGGIGAGRLHTFPDEIFAAPRSWVEQGYPTLTSFNKATRAGTSPPGRSRSCSRARSGPRSGPCANRRQGAARAVRRSFMRRAEWSKPQTITPPLAP